MPRSRPPGPDQLPIVGNTHQFVRDTTGFYEDAARYGDLATLDILGVGEHYLVTDPAIVRRILVGERDAFGKPSQTQEQIGPLVGEGLVLSEGELWRRQRQLIQPAFYRDRIAVYSEMITRHAAETADRWTDGETVELVSEMKRLALRILVEAMFGSDIDYEGLELHETVRRIREPGQPLKQPIANVVPMWVPIPMWRRYHQAIEYFEGIVGDLVRERREAERATAGDRTAPDPSDDESGPTGRPDGVADDATTEAADAPVSNGGIASVADSGVEQRTDRDDLLSLLLHAHGEEGGMSDEQLRDEMMTFLFAGHETTALSLMSTWFLLSKNPDARKRLDEELADVLDGDEPTMDDLDDLTYTEAVIKEAMRLYPPVPNLPRETTRPVDVGGYALPEGSTVVASQWTIQRDGSYWAYPHEFRPERWLDGDGELRDESAADRPEFAYFPFGGGPRRCVGAQFAMVEAKLVVATIARRYRLDVRPDEFDVATGITLIPLHDVEADVRAR